MDIIYGGASLVIINAAGSDANHGLPGVREGSRRHVQVPFSLNGVLLLRTLDPCGIAGESGYLEGTKWSTRG
jgi:hypothetical protein